MKRGLNKRQGDPGLEPSIRDIVDYWAGVEDECGLAVDWAEAHKFCWRCGYKARLQKCHIVPKARGGALVAANLVLLCRRCHREAPNVADPRFMWIWLRATSVPFYETWIWSKALQEFEKMFGRLPFAGQNADELLNCDWKPVAREEWEKTVIHFGEGRLNPATLACVLAATEEKLTGQPLKGVTSSSEAAYFLCNFLGLKPVSTQSSEPTQGQLPTAN